MESTSRNAAKGGDKSQPIHPHSHSSVDMSLPQFRGENNPIQGQKSEDWIAVYHLLAVWLWVNSFVLMNSPVPR